MKITSIEIRFLSEGGAVVESHPVKVPDRACKVAGSFYDIADKWVGFFENNEVSAF